MLLGDKHLPTVHNDSCEGVKNGYEEFAREEKADFALSSSTWATGWNVVLKNVGVLLADRLKPAR